MVDILKRLCDDDSSDLIRDAAAEIAALRAERTAFDALVERAKDERYSSEAIGIAFRRAFTS